MFDTAVFHELGGFDEDFRYGEDNDLVIRLTQAYEVRHLPQALVTRRRNYGISACIATTPPEEVLEHHLAVFRKHYHLCVDDPRMLRALYRGFAWCYRSQGKHVFRLSPQHHKQVARQWFKKSLQVQVTGETLFWYLRSYLP